MEDKNEKNEGRNNEFMSILFSFGYKRKHVTIFFFMFFLLTNLKDN